MFYRNLHCLLLLLPLACAAKQKDGFRVEGEPTALQIYEIQEAIDEWCFYGHCAWLGDGNSIVRMVETMPESAMPGTIGFYELSTDGESSRISILKGFSSKEVPIRKTMLHELGHHWGCKNRDESDSDEPSEPGFVMSLWTDEQPNHLTPEDVACATR
jgi:hypothetical protein